MEQKNDGYFLDLNPDLGKRHLIKYRDENAYFIHLYNKEGMLRGIDIYQSAKGKNTSETISGMHLIIYMANLIIKLGAFRALLKILKKSSLGKRTLAGIIYSELAEYLNTDKEPIFSCECKMIVIFRGRVSPARRNYPTISDSRKVLWCEKCGCFEIVDYKNKMMGKNTPSRIPTLTN